MIAITQGNLFNSKAWARDLRIMAILALFVSVGCFSTVHLADSPLPRTTLGLVNDLTLLAAVYWYVERDRRQHGERVTHLTLFVLTLNMLITSAVVLANSGSATADWTTSAALRMLALLLTGYVFPVWMAWMTQRRLKLRELFLLTACAAVWLAFVAAGGPL
jgi:hypothetical protein